MVQLFVERLQRFLELGVLLPRVCPVSGQTLGNKTEMCNAFGVEFFESVRAVRRAENTKGIPIRDARYNSCEKVDFI